MGENVEISGSPSTGTSHPVVVQAANWFAFCVNDLGSVGYGQTPADQAERLGPEVPSSWEGQCSRVAGRTPPLYLRYSTVPEKRFIDEKSSS